MVDSSVVIIGKSSHISASVLNEFFPISGGHLCYICTITNSCHGDPSIDVCGVIEEIYSESGVVLCPVAVGLQVHLAGGSSRGDHGDHADDHADQQQDAKQFFRTGCHSNPPSMLAFDRSRILKHVSRSESYLFDYNGNVS